MILTGCFNSFNRTLRNALVPLPSQKFPANFLVPKPFSIQPMKKSTVWFSAIFLLVTFSLAAFKPAFSEKKIDRNKMEPVVHAGVLPLVQDHSSSIRSLYEKLNLASRGLAFETFHLALNGYNKLLNKGLVTNPILSIADMSQPSCQKRLYVINMQTQQLLINTLVAHGRNSGEAKAAKFSNTPESLQSSLGFYITGGTYLGNNGFSMRLKGMEPGFNDQAENRAIVMHGAPYVNEDIARKTGRIGRSWGCPAVSVQEHQQIINLVKNGSCLYVFAPEKQYLAKSSLSSETTASL